MKRDPLDILFSLYIRTRDNWTCQRCFSQKPEKSQGLHCSHIFSRRHKATRWDEQNAKALCFSCHQWYGGNPVESAAWVEDWHAVRWGPDALDELRQRKNAPFKLTKSFRDERKAELTAKLKALTEAAA